MRSDLAVFAKGISKQYHLGAAGKNHSNLRESIMDSSRNVIAALRGGMKRSRRLREENSFWALKDVSFEVKQGEVVGLIGGNGAGKSTLLKVLSRITDPTSGYVDMRGRVGSLLEVGTGFHPELSGRENIFLNGAILGMPKTQVTKAFDEIVDFAGVEKFVDTAVKRYSSGMYLRLAFAVAAHLDPEILLVDEVLAVGDAKFQNKCIGKMESVAKQGRTVLFVSHNMAAIRSLCSRGLLIRHGEIAFQGDVQDAIQEYYQDLGILGNDSGDDDNHRRYVFGRVSLNRSNTNSINQTEPFELSTTFSLPSTASGFRLFCMFDDMRNQRLLGICKTSEELGFDGEIPTGLHQVSVRFPTLWLSPGMYSVTFKLIMSGGVDTKNHISNSFPLDVSGESSPGGYEAVLHPHTDWVVDAEATDANANIELTGASDDPRN